jgi:hypothetical protein
MSTLLIPSFSRPLESSFDAFINLYAATYCKHVIENCKVSWLYLWQQGVRIGAVTERLGAVTYKAAN